MPEKPRTSIGSTVRFAGKVLDAKAGAPIDGAQVELWPAGHGKHSEIGTATDEQGRFELSRLEPGCEYLLTVRAPGHRPVFDDVRIPETGLTKDYRLESAPPPRILCRDPAGNALANVPMSLFIGDSDLSHLYARAITDIAGECALDGAIATQITRGVDFFDRNARCCVTAKPQDIRLGASREEDAAAVDAPALDRRAVLEHDAAGDLEAARHHVAGRGIDSPARFPQALRRDGDRDRAGGEPLQPVAAALVGARAGDEEVVRGERRVAISEA